MTNIEKYYCYYNDEDDKYYVEEAYPQKKKKKLHDGCKVYVKVNCCDDHKEGDKKKKDCNCHKCHKEHYYEAESDY
ncbi:hypothetical protein N7983_27140 [Priestia megaterium]|uniref:hypothetical protein n=1 Tax=Priestia megaterium TaxID=1404 RepID=UPI001C22D028|nr:hypothetical protein [Priestia megaterium]MBU8757024.1 hypothetical protein [Priestia megaterium]MCU7746755.1 hypothetical protein [Priestia megaterium]